jgi:hypothetical protein
MRVCEYVCGLGILRVFRLDAGCVRVFVYLCVCVCAFACMHIDF